MRAPQRIVGRAGVIGLCAGAGFAWSSAQAAQVTANWLAPVSGSWVDATKWSTPQFPNNGNPAGTTYHAVIWDTQHLPYTVMVDQDVALDELTFHSIGPAGARGTISGAGELFIESHFKWDSGVLAGSGTTIVGEAGMLTLYSNPNTLSRTLEVRGTTLLTTLGSVNFDNGIFVNSGDFVVAASATGTVSWGGTGQFINNGTIENQGAPSFSLDVPLYNNGTILVGGDTSLGQTFNAGEIVVQAGQLLELNRSLHHTGGVLIGEGDLDISGGVHDLDPSGMRLTGSLLVAGAQGVTIRNGMTFESIEHRRGVLVVSENVDINAPFMIRGSSIIQGDGQLHVPMGEALSLASGYNFDKPILVGATIVADGLLEWTGSDLGLDGGELVSRGEMILASKLMTCYSEPGAWTNTGLVYKLDPGVTTLTGEHMRFINDGAVQIDAGTLLIACENENSGSYIVGGAGTLRLGRAGLWSADARLLGDGRVTLAADGHVFDQQWIDFGGVISITSGTPRFDGSVSAGVIVLASQEATFDGLVRTSELRVQPGARLRGEGDIEIAGRLSWTGGAMSGEGRTILTESGKATINSLSTLSLERILVNQGIIEWSNAFWTLRGGGVRNEGSFVASSFVGAAATSMFGGVGGGEFLNEGTMIVEGGGQVRLLRNGGDMVFENTGVVEVREGSFQLLGSDVTSNHGVYDIRHSGDMEIDGDFENAGAASLSFEVGGMKERGLSGLMTITGEASLTGTLSVSTPEAFSATWGDRWVVMTYGSVEGDFDVFDLPIEGFASRSDEFGVSDLRWYAERGETEYAVGVSHVADIDHDGLIGFGDLNVIASNFNAFGSWAEGDVDGDGLVGFTDLNTVLSLFNVSAPRSVPGPGGVVVLVLAAGSGLRRRRESSGSFRKG